MEGAHPVRGVPRLRRFHTLMHDQQQLHLAMARSGNGDRRLFITPAQLPVPRRIASAHHYVTGFLLA